MASPVNTFFEKTILTQANAPAIAAEMCLFRMFLDDVDEYETIRKTQWYRHPLRKINLAFRIARGAKFAIEKAEELLGKDTTIKFRKYQPLKND